MNEFKKTKYPSPLQIHRLDNLNKCTDIIENILTIQKQWLANRSSFGLTDGFLISAFEPIELLELVRNHGQLYYSSDQTGLVEGYILMTPIEEFTSLFKDPKIGQYLNGPKHLPTNIQYLYQIAITKDKSKLGIGSNLVKHVLRNTQSSILTDILVSPIKNDASIKFFKNHGFKEAGTLELSEYRDFGKLISQVLIWNP